MDPDPVSSRIFISYRREDSAGHVLALLPALRSQFGADRIFKDTDNIPPGVDFVKFIKRELDSCSVLLAIIGRDWVNVQDPRLKRRRLDNPDDFLRLEVATALKSERIRVIPVLVERSVMPAPEDLPPDLAELPLRNALELSDSRWESDVQRLIQAIQAVSAAAVPPPAAPTPRAGLLDLQKRRAREIAAHLQAAQEAFEARDYEATLLACEKALVLDPQGSDALKLLDLARKALDDQKTAAWLAQAKQLLSEGQLADASELIDQALSLDTSSEQALTLRQELLRLRREREQDRERSRVVQAAVERARASLDEEDFDSAVRHADDALAVEPQSAEAQEIRSNAQTALNERRRQREHKRRAQQTVSEARAQFAAGHHEDALRLLHDFSPTHDLVSQTLLELQKEADAIGESRRQIAEMIENAAAAVTVARFEDAIALLREVGGLDPGRADVAALLSQAETGLASAAAAERARREADAKLSEASAKFQEQDFPGAQQLVEAARGHDPQHPELGPWLRRIEDALAKQATAAERRAATQTALTNARAHFEKGQFEAAIDRADAALAIEPTLDEARTVRDRARAALAERRKREEHERLAKQVVEQAQGAFKAEDHKAAIELLERFSPPHAQVSQALAELRQQLQDIAQRRRQQEEEEAKRREKAERAAAERKRTEALQAILARGQVNLGREDFEAALRDANEVLSLDPRSKEAQELRSAASTALEQRIQRAEQDRLAQQAAAKARAKAEEAAKERRDAEARARDRARDLKIAAAISAAEQSGSHEEALRHLREALALDPANDRLQKLIAARALARDREEAERRQQQALEQRIQQLLAEAQAAFAAKKFRRAKAKTADVLQLAPGNDIARSLLASATRELDAATPEFWSPTRLTGVGSAAVVLLATVWIWNGGSPSDSQSPADQPLPGATTTTPPPTTGGPEPVVPRAAEPPRTEPAPPAATPAATRPATPSATPASAPTAPTIPPVNEPRLQRLALLRDTARGQLQSGQRTQALETTAEGLKLDPKDTVLLSVQDALLRDAQTSAQRARDAARNSEAPSLAPATFNEAQALESEAMKLQAANRKDAAIRSFWDAAVGFALAGQQADARRETRPPVAAAPVQPLPPANAPVVPPTSKTEPSPPESSRPPLVSRATEEPRVRQTLGQYERAYDNLSVDDVRKVYPRVQADAVRLAFGQMRSYDMALQIQSVEFSPDVMSATVVTSVTHDLRPKVGASSRQTRTQTFSLEKQGNAWVIVQVR